MSGELAGHGMIRISQHVCIDLFPMIDIIIVVKIARLCSCGCLSLFCHMSASQQSAGRPVVHGTMGCGQKSFQQCHQILSGVVANGHLPRVSRQSLPSANDWGDNEMVPGAMHRSPGIYLIAEKTPPSISTGDHR